MAQQMGNQPLIVLSEDSQRTSGRDAQSMNITAGKAVAESVRTTLGPKGMDKMLVDSTGNAVVRDDDVARRVDEHLVHPFRAERGPYGLGDRLARGDVHRLRVAAGRSLALLGKNDEGLVAHLLCHSHSNDCMWFYIKVAETEGENRRRGPLQECELIAHRI